MSDQFFPQTIDLSASAVQKIQTSQVNPRVVLDASGLAAYDASGNEIFDLSTGQSATAQGLILPAYLGSGSQDKSEVIWTEGAGGSKVAGLLGEYISIGGGHNESLMTVQAQPGQAGDDVVSALEARDLLANLRAWIYAFYNDSNGTNSIGAIAGATNPGGTNGNVVTIIDNTNHSDFGRVFGGQVVFSGVSIPGQSKSDFTINTGSNLPAKWQLLVMLRDDGISTFMSYCTWALITSTANSLTFEVANNLPAGDTATGSICATILNVT